MTQTTPTLAPPCPYSPANPKAGAKSHRDAPDATDALLRRNHAANCDRIAAFLSLPGVAEMAARDWAELKATSGVRYAAKATRPCAVPWCDRTTHNGTLCASHEARATRYGDPLLCKAMRSSNGNRILCREVGRDAAGGMILEEVTA